MPAWVQSLSSLIKAWLAASPDRNISSLQKAASAHHTISYGTVAAAHQGDHEVSLPSVLCLLKVVIPTTQGRQVWFEQNLPDYYLFAKEFFDRKNGEDRIPRALSHPEARVLRKLIARKSFPIDHARIYLGDSLYESFVSWLDYHKLGREEEGQLVTTGPDVIVEDMHTSKKVVASAVDEMDASKLDGDLMIMALGTTNKETASQIWHIQFKAWKESKDLMKNNPGEHTVLVANIMKYD